MNAAPAHDTVHAVAWQGGVEDAALRICDRRSLPVGSVHREVSTLAGVCSALRVGRIAGAGAQAQAVAFAVPLHVFVAVRGRRCSEDRLEAIVSEAIARLSATVPASVPAQRALRRIRECFDRHVGKLTPIEVGARLLMEAKRFQREAGELSQRIAKLGVGIFPRTGTVVIVGATGAYAYAGEGTSLAIIKAVLADGGNLSIQVLAGSDGGTTQAELRGHTIAYPDLAELARALRRRSIAAVCIGAERVTAAGDVLAAAGAYALAALAKAHGIPVIAAAPYTYFDFSVDHGEDTREHDVVPADLVDAVVTGRGIIRRPTRAAVEALMRDGDDSGV